MNRSRCIRNGNAMTFVWVEGFYNGLNHCNYDRWREKLGFERREIKLYAAINNLMAGARCKSASATESASHAWLTFVMFFWNRFSTHFLCCILCFDDFFDFVLAEGHFCRRWLTFVLWIALTFHELLLWFCFMRF